MYYDFMDGTPVGRLVLVMQPRGLSHLLFEHGRHPRPLDPDWKRDASALAEPRRQLDEYFAGRRTAFDIPLAPQGTAFQQSVWRELLEIGYGETTSYKFIAEKIGKPAACRAVGAANGQNPISIIVPCHRVVGASGTLTGYGGGLPNKQLLLDLEHKHRPFRLTA